MLLVSYFVSSNLGFLYICQYKKKRGRITTAELDHQDIQLRLVRNCGKIDDDENILR